tara:strand:+ start:6582 stop:7568 length:987 start_codon:yes stop_codon:yes gene_type:complete
MQIFFNRDKFHKIKNLKKLDFFCKLFEQNIINYNISNNFFVKDISSPNYLRDNSIIFIKDDKFFKKFDSKNLCLISDNQDLINNNLTNNFFYVKNIDQSYNDFANYIFSHDDSIDYEDKFEKINNSLVSKYSNIHPSSILGNNCVVGKGVTIGKNCIIKNNVTIKNSIINDDVIICENSSIGTSGFGFDLKNMGAKFISPQLGIVYIDSNVHIGALCTIDRAKIDITYIGKNSMIDNHVHIAHNVIIGNNACIAAQSGISGSVKIGKNLISGGQSGYAGHITVGDNVVVAAKSGVTKNIPNNTTVAGFPAIDIKLWKRNIIKNKKNGY